MNEFNFDKFDETSIIETYDYLKSLPNSLTIKHEQNIGGVAVAKKISNDLSLRLIDRLGITNVNLEQADADITEIDYGLLQTAKKNIKRCFDNKHLMGVFQTISLQLDKSFLKKFPLYNYFEAISNYVFENGLSKFKWRSNLNGNYFAVDPSIYMLLGGTNPLTDNEDTNLRDRSNSFLSINTVNNLITDNLHLHLDPSREVASLLKDLPTNERFNYHLGNYDLASGKKRVDWRNLQTEKLPFNESPRLNLLNPDQELDTKIKIEILNLYIQEQIPFKENRLTFMISLLNTYKDKSDLVLNFLKQNVPNTNLRLTYWDTSVNPNVQIVFNSNDLQNNPRLILNKIEII
jgi:hypothetical protein